MAVESQIGVMPAVMLVSSRSRPARRIWPMAGLGIGLLVNAAWIGFLGYETCMLVGRAFF